MQRGGFGKGKTAGTSVPVRERTHTAGLDSAMSSGVMDPTVDWVAIDEAVELLKLDEFLRSNWRRITSRVEREARKLWEGEFPGEPDSPSLLRRIRPLLDGIAYLGSPHGYKRAHSALEERLPSGADAGLVLAASVLSRIGREKVRRSRCAQKRRAWEKILSQIDRQA